MKEEIKIDHFLIASMFVKEVISVERKCVFGGLRYIHIGTILVKRKSAQTYHHGPNHQISRLTMNIVTLTYSYVISTTVNI